MPVIGQPGDLCRSVFGTWFLSIPMLQWWADLPIWERIFNERPYKQVLELGSGRGAMSAYLLMQCIQRGIQYNGVDHVTTQIGATPMGKLLDIDSHIITGDLWSELITGKIRGILADPANHPLLLFCDNGDKPREFKLFAPLLSKGDTVAVHDYENEFSPADVSAAMATRLARLYPAEVDALPGGVLTRWWEVTA